jgi:hypothetical protein
VFLLTGLAAVPIGPVDGAAVRMQAAALPPVREISRALSASPATATAGLWCVLTADWAGMLLPFPHCVPGPVRQGCSII